eukprot:3211262-Rhodomonas_salina.2
MVAVLALSCTPTSYSIVSGGNLATTASVQGSLRLQGASEEAGGKTWAGARIATPRLVLRGGAETAVANKRVSLMPGKLCSSRVKDTQKTFAFCIFASSFCECS